MLEELLLHQLNIENWSCLFPTLSTQFDPKMVNLSFQILDLYQQEILVELFHILMVAQLGIVHPLACPFSTMNIEVDQGGPIPQWYTGQMQWLGWKGF